MTKPISTRETSSTWRKSWAVKLLAVALVLAAFQGCASGKREDPAAPKSDAGIERLKEGWLGRFGARDAKLSGILTGQLGWEHLKEMELFEAIRLFSVVPERSSRLGAVRTYTEMALMYEALDGLMQNVEVEYLAALKGAPPGVASRLGLLRLKAGDVEAARDIFFSKGQAPKPSVAELVGQAGVMLADALRDKAQALMVRASEQAKTADECALVRMAAYEWGLPGESGQCGYYGQSLDALKANDLFSAVVSLQMIEDPWHALEAGADIYLYSLYKKIFAHMSIDTASRVKGVGGGYFEGRARLMTGDARGGLLLFEGLREDTSPFAASDDAAWLYGPELGGEDALALAEVYKGEALYLMGRASEAEKIWKTLLDNDPGALALSRMAALQVKFKASAPLGDPRQAVDSALAATISLKESALDIEPGGEAIATLLNVRLANIYHYGAQVAYALGSSDTALDYMDRAHWKRKGNQPTYVNPPAFIVGLAKAYLDSGQYAPAVDMMFGMSSHFPSSRMAYESLKRLYASKTGGEAPPI